MRPKGTILRALTRTALLAGLAGSLTTPALGAGDSEKAPADPRWEQERLAYADSYTRFMALLDQPETLAPASMSDADLTGNRIALYRVGDPRNRRYPAELYEAIENRMFDRLLNGGAFRVYECMQCKTVRVTIRDNHLSMAHRAESNARLREIGEKVGVDGLLLWDAYAQGERVVLDTRLMDVETGRVVWSHKYTHAVRWQRQWVTYLGLWGIETTGFSYTPGVPDVSADRLMVAGAELREATSLFKGLTYGLGLNMFRNTAKRDQDVKVDALTLYARLGQGLDPLFGYTGKQYSNFELYLAVGDAFIEDANNLLVRAGLEVRFTQRLFMDLGWVYLEDQELDIGNPPPGEPGGEVGGSGYDVSLGLRF